jgi:glycosyltransferase involved in cell wall biosynthesis
MRILVFTREFPPYVAGGMSYHLAYLYSELVELGHEVTVLAGAPSDASKAASELVAEAINSHYLPYGRVRGQHLKYPLQLWRFLRRFDIQRFDIAVTHTPLPFGISIPLVGKYHDCPQEERQYFRQEMTALERAADTVLNPTRQLVDRWSLSTVDASIFNSKLCRRAWNRHYDVDVPSRVIHNGVDTEVFCPQDVDPDEEYVLFVGDSERKGLSRVRSFAAHSELSVVIVGDVENGQNIQVVDRVSPDRMAELYSGAIATVHPAKFEAFGNVVLESLACGTPVVTTSQCGASEVLDSECRAIDVTLAKGIRRCRSVPSDKCRDIARRRTWENVGKRTESYLQSIRS